MDTRSGKGYSCMSLNGATDEGMNKGETMLFNAVVDICILGDQSVAKILDIQEIQP